MFGCVLALAGRGPEAGAATRSASWSHFDVTLDLRTDGSYHVAERQEIAFSSGPFRTGFANLSLNRVDAFDNVTLGGFSPNGGAAAAFRQVGWNAFAKAPNTYAYRTTNSQVEIVWGFPATSDATLGFLLEYDVRGGLRVYTDPPNQQVWWTAVNSDVTGVGPVDNATMTIRLPRAVDPKLAQVDETGKVDPQTHTVDGKTWTWSAANLRSGDAFDVRLRVPPIVDAQPPSWQLADDRQRAAAETQSQRSALVNLIFLAIAALLAVLGGVGLYALWYLRGRDPHVGLVAEFLAEPPDDLPAGAVGALLDETADQRDVAATLIDLGRRKVLRMEEGTGEGGYGRDYTLTLLEPAGALRPFESTVMQAVFGDAPTAGASARMSGVKGRFDAASGKVKDQIYDELVTRGYFRVSPERSRSRWRRTGRTALIAIAVLGCVGGGVFGSRSVFYWVAVVVAAALAGILMSLSRSLPKKTDAGAEAAAKWRAFRTYLHDLNKYENVAESKQIFERYLAFTVAFGLQESWVARFEEVGSRMPDWFGAAGGGMFDGGSMPRGYGRRRGGGPIIIGGGGFGGFGGAGGDGSSGNGGGGLPDLQDASDRAGRSLQGSSNSLFDMLNEAAKAFGSISGKGGGGGGWGGGGSSGGGGGGGGGGRGFG